jgi:hypothetical protein
LSAYEVALLVATALFVCILLWDNHKIRGRLERSEANIVWLVATAKNTIDVHQKTMDVHTRAIERLDEQTGKIAQAGERFRQSQPNFSKLRADVDRLLKSSMYRDTASQAAMQRLLEDGQAELRGNRMEGP